MTEKYLLGRETDATDSGFEDCVSHTESSDGRSDPRDGESSRRRDSKRFSWPPRRDDDGDDDVQVAAVPVPSV